MEIRAITEEEVSVYRRSMIGTFGGDPAEDPTGDDRFRALVDRSRAFAAFDRGAVVATAATFDIALTAPGGAVLPVAGLTMVSVRPTHRRRGILRALMATFLADARGRGNAVSGLWASDSAIYGRFGYGVATEYDSVSFGAAGLAVGGRGERDELELVEEADARELLPSLYARAVARPGMLARSAAWWHHRRFTDRPDLRHGASPRRHVLARRGGEATGYITYRHRPEWEDAVAKGAVEIDEIIALDARAETSLWQFACSVDLFPNVSWWNAPVDSLLPWIVDQPRRIRRRRNDGLWLRIDDPASALAARRYPADGRLRFAVIDEAGGDGGSYELVVEGGAGRCAPTSAGAELRVARTALGSLYLGGATASLLARAGQIDGDAAAVARADRLFGWSQPPWCEEIF